MIDPIELRIGNYVYDITGHVVAITTLGCGAVMYRGINPKELIEGFSGYNSIKPIPLTEDILLKCGFKKLSNNGYRLGYLLYRLKHRSIQDLRYRDTEVFYDDVSYLHRLQNLFYDLTKTELNIQL